MASIGSTTADVSKKNLQSQENMFKDEASHSTNLKIYPNKENTISITRATSDFMMRKEKSR